MDLNKDAVSSSKDFISILHFLLIINDKVILGEIKKYEEKKEENHKQVS